MVEASVQTEPPEEGEKKPLAGKWVDESKSWYDGSVIEIQADGKWKPVKPKQKVHQKAYYTSRIVSDTEWDLIETREDGDLREFKLLQDEASSVFVHFKNPDGTLHGLKWKLQPYDESKAAQRRRIQDLVKPTSGLPHVDLFKHEFTLAAVRHNASAIVNHTAFDMLVGVVILANSVLIGVEIDLSIDRGVDDAGIGWIEALDKCFLGFYVFELGLRFTSRGFAFFKDSWGMMDTMLVTVGLLIIPLKGVMDGWLLKRIMIFRILRLVKVLQPVRTFEIMQPLWKLISGLTHAMGTLASTFLVIIFVLYIFACIGGEVIAQNAALLKLAEDPENEAGKVVEEKFSSLWVIMLTLIQFTTADITDIYFPLVNASPWLAIYFGLAYLVITILLMNLVTAVLVEDAIARSSEDIKIKTKKTRRKLDKFIPQLEQVFDQVDHDSTGDISLQELAEWTPPEAMELDSQVKEVMKPETLEECYECFDADNSGLVSKEEFVQGALAVLLKDAPQELTQLLQLVRASNKQLIAIQGRLDAMEVRLT